ncbi:efflux transporter outer membrane subunit [Ideonella azotifigens]|uniref:Efflux transporter outer membrane subunit n=2 Tax=Ideonella azotifigens TaxID=513160 RepID=A0ABP3VJU8_9BURK
MQGPMLPHPLPDRFRPALLALSLALALPAWAAAPEDRPPESAAAAASAATPLLPMSWLRAGPGQAKPADGAVLAQWWQQFDDADLSALVREALARNTDLRVARSTLAQAQAARAATVAGARPQVGTSASASRNHSNNANSNQFQVGLSASWNPDLNGSQQAAIDAAGADVAVATQDLHATQVSLAAEVGLAYLGLRDAQARQRITQASLDSFEDSSQLVSWRVQAGLASGLDLDQARLSTEQTRASLPSLTTEVAQYESQLALLTGRSLQALQGSLAQVSAMPNTEPLVDRLAVGVPADLLRQRPDLRAAEASVAVQWSRRDQTRREGLPAFSLSGSAGLQALTLAGLGASGAGIASLAAAFSWQLFDGGQREALVAQQDAALDATRIQYEAVVLTALKDVEDSLVAVRGSRERVGTLRKAATAAQNVFDATRQRHQVGLIDTASLLEAQRNLLSTQTSLQSTQTELSQNLVQLYKALGGGWTPDGETAATAPSAKSTASSPVASR